MKSHRFCPTFIETWTRLSINRDYLTAYGEKSILTNGMMPWFLPKSKTSTIKKSLLSSSIQYGSSATGWLHTIWSTRPKSRFLASIKPTTHRRLSTFSLPRYTSWPRTIRHSTIKSSISCRKNMSCSLSISGTSPSCMKIYTFITTTRKSAIQIDSPSPSSYNRMTSIYSNTSSITKKWRRIVCLRRLSLYTSNQTLTAHTSSTLVFFHTFTLICPKYQTWSLFSIASTTKRQSSIRKILAYTRS